MDADAAAGLGPSRRAAEARRSYSRGAQHQRLFLHSLDSVTTVRRLVASRKVSHLKIYLPLGSSEGDYDIRISGPEGEILFGATGAASTEQGIRYLAVDVSLSSARPGLYVLQLQKVGSSWSSYPLRVVR